MVNKLIIQKEIMELKLKEKEARQREELITQLKTQMDVIMHFRSKFSTIPHEVQLLLNEAQKIMKVLGIGSI